MESKKKIKEIKKEEVKIEVKKIEVKKVEGNEVIGCILISKLDHPIDDIIYDGKAMMIPPRANIKIKNEQLLGALPKGIIKIRDKK